MPHSHHSHSGQFCRHAKDNLEGIVKEAIQQGFEVYGLTEHAPRYRVEDLYPEEADLSIADIQAAYQSFLSTALSLKRKYANQITLLIGLESDYITDLDLERTIDLLASHPEIEYIVGSVHHVGGIPIDFDRDTWLRAVYACGQTGSSAALSPLSELGTVETSLLQIQPTYSPSSSELRPFILAYLNQQLHMIRTLRPEVIGHFDLFRLWTPELDVRSPELNREGERGVWEAIRRNVEEGVRIGALFEMNTAAFRKGWNTAYPCRPIAELIIESGGRFCFSDDSHGVTQVGLNYHRLRDYAESLGMKSTYYLAPLGTDVETADEAGEAGPAGAVQARPRRVEVELAENILSHPFWDSHKR